MKEQYEAYLVRNKYEWIEVQKHFYKKGVHWHSGDYQDSYHPSKALIYPTTINQDKQGLWFCPPQKDKSYKVLRSYKIKKILGIYES